MHSLSFSPSIVIGLNWFRVTHAHDLRAMRAADRLTDQLAQQSIRYLLEGGRLRVESSPEAGVVHVVSHDGCSCHGARHPWCIHRVLRVILLAEVALLSSQPQPTPHQPGTANARAARAPSAEYQRALDALLECYP